MTKPTRKKREQMASRARNHIEVQDDADKFEQPTELDIQPEQTAEDEFTTEPDEEETPVEWEEPES